MGVTPIPLQETRNLYCRVLRALRSQYRAIFHQRWPLPSWREREDDQNNWNGLLGFRRDVPNQKSNRQAQKGSRVLSQSINEDWGSALTCRQLASLRY
jgi:hypothetical protein